MLYFQNQWGQTPLIDSAAALKEKFSYFQVRHSEADGLGYAANAAHRVSAANQEEIANKIYNGVSGNTQLGNGNISSGDGWKYRGRGLKQLTGRYNYTAFNNAYPAMWPNENLNFVGNPDLLHQARYALRSGVYFWLTNKLYEIADTGSTNGIVNSVTRVINQYTDSYPERVVQFRRIYEESKVFKSVS